MIEFESPKMEIPVDPRVHWGVVIPKAQPVCGPNERCIEIPLAVDVLDIGKPGWVLDAGCSLNGTIQQFTGTAARIVHLTQHIGSEPLKAEQPVSFVSADLRDLSLFAYNSFARTVCVSTLEHIGLDNSYYHGGIEDCPRTVSAAVKELCRVTRHSLLITVPYGEPPIENAQWRFIGQKELGYMVRVLGEHGFAVQVRFYAKCDGGWYGGELQPVEASVEGYPEHVNAIACLWGTR